MDDNPYTAPQAQHDGPPEPPPLLPAPLLTAFVLFVVLPLLVVILVLFQWLFE